MWIEHTYAFATEFNAQENEGLTITTPWICFPSLWTSQTQLSIYLLTWAVPAMLTIGLLVRWFYVGCSYTEVCNSVSLLLLVNVRTDVSGLREWYGSLAASANLTQMYLQFEKLAERPNAKNSTTKYANNYHLQILVWMWVCEPVGVHVHAHSKSTPTWTAINHPEMFIPGSWGCIQRTNIWVWSALNYI